MGLPSIDLWSKMQETDGWQKKFLRFVIFKMSYVNVMIKVGLTIVLFVSFNLVPATQLNESTLFHDLLHQLTVL